MASVAQLNYVRVLLRKAGANPEEYTLTEEIPHKEISGFIEALRDGEVEEADTWNARVENRDGAVADSNTKGTFDKNCFDYIIPSITTPIVKSFVRTMLNNVPEYFFEVPASSTGKYHPKISLGQGGLVRHTQAAIEVAIALFDNPSMGIDKRSRDIILAAIILHDCCKHGLEMSNHTRHDHPMLVRKLWETCKIAELSEEDEQTIEEILSGIESHMGPWTTNKYSEVVLPKPESKIAKLIHLADYISSRKFMSLTNINSGGPGF